MKISKYWFIIWWAVVPLFFSCSKESNDNKDLYVYNAPGNSGYNVLSSGNFMIVGSSAIPSANTAFPVYISRSASQDVNVTATIDTSLVHVYDSLYKPATASPTLPAGAFSLLNNGKVTIKAGNTSSSDSVRVILGSYAGLKMKTTYTIPVVLSMASGGASVSGSRNVMFARILVDSVLAGISALDNSNMVSVMLSLPVTTSTTVGTIYLKGILNNAVGQALTLSVNDNSSLVQAYNTANGTNCVALPTGTFNIVKANVNFPASTVNSSDSIAIQLTNLTALVQGNDYLLPIQVVANNTGAVTDPTKQVVYIRVRFNNVDPSNAGLTGTTMNRASWTATASSTYYTGYGASNVLDGSNSTPWLAAAIPAYLVLNMGTPATAVKGFTFYPYGSSTYTPLNVEVYSSTDGVNWNMEGTYSSTSTSVATKMIKFVTPVTAQYFKFNITKANNTVLTGFAEVNGIQ